MDDNKLESIIFGLKETINEQNAEIGRLIGDVAYWERKYSSAVKDTAKEIYSKVKNKSGAELSFLNDLALWIKERFGVAVEKWIKIDGVEVE